MKGNNYTKWRMKNLIFLWMSRYLFWFLISVNLLSKIEIIIIASKYLLSQLLLIHVKDDVTPYINRKNANDSNSNRTSNVWWFIH